MDYRIPDELFNRIEYPLLGMAEVPLDGLVAEIAYKLPEADPVAVKREAWHSMCDFSARTGAMLARTVSDPGSSANIEPGAGRVFMRVVGAKAKIGESGEWTPEVRFRIESVSDNGTDYLTAVFPDEEVASCEIVYSVRPVFDDASRDVSLDSNGDWRPTVPQYMIDRYGECVAHGALMRLHAMRGEGALARMHATAYNNDLNRFAFGLLTSGMRRHLLIDVEDFLVNTSSAQEA